MANFFGKEMSEVELRKYVGDLSQTAGIKKYSFEEGKAKGVTAYDIKNGAGLNLTVVEDRGLDIAWVEYKGVPLGFISKVGVSSPAFYESQGYGYMRNFFAGFMSTCGLTYMGEPCVDEGQELGKHGRVNNIPAENVNKQVRWEGDELTIELSGQVRECAISCENMVLSRTITAKAGQKSFMLNDEVINMGFTEQPIMMIYHFNFGYPLLSETTKLYIPRKSTKSFNADSEERVNEYDSFTVPRPDIPDLVYYHDLKTTNDNNTYACLFNPELGEDGLGACLKYRKDQLPVLIEWKSLKQGDYVVGIEPSTGYADGRAAARERGELKMIQPHETKKYDIEVTIVEGKEELQKLIKLESS